MTCSQLSRTTSGALGRRNSTSRSSTVTSAAPVDAQGGGDRSGDVLVGGERGQRAAPDPVGVSGSDEVHEMAAQAGLAHASRSASGSRAAAVRSIPASFPSSASRPTKASGGGAESGRGERSSPSEPGPPRADLSSAPGATAARPRLPARPAPSAEVGPTTSTGGRALLLSLRSLRRLPGWPGSARARWCRESLGDDDRGAEMVSVDQHRLARVQADADGCARAAARRGLGRPRLVA